MVSEDRRKQVREAQARSRAKKIQDGKTPVSCYLSQQALSDLSIIKDKVPEAKNNDDAISYALAVASEKLLTKL